MEEVYNTFSENFTCYKDNTKIMSDKLTDIESTVLSAMKSIESLSLELDDLKKRLIDPLDVKIKYHREKYPDLKPVEKYGNFYDLRAAQSMKLKKKKHYYIPLGISMYIPDGYYAEVLPRSGTFKHFKFFVANSMGIIDDNYRSTEDEWFLSVYPTKTIKIEANDRIAQFTIVKERDINLNECDSWEAKKRGGFGTSGIK